MKLYGQPRDRMTRLKAVALKGDFEVYVSAALDWQAGDQVALLPTATQSLHTDYMTIESYDNKTGHLTFTDVLKFYHWGK